MSKRVKTNCKVCGTSCFSSTGYCWDHYIENVDIGAKRRGATHSEESKMKMRKSLQGRISNFKGKVHSEEAKEKNRQAHLGKPTWNKGKTNIYSDESLKKMSDAHAGKTLSPEHKAKIGRPGKSNSMYGKSVYDVWIEKYGKDEADRLKRLSNEKRIKTMNDVNVRKKMRLSYLKYQEKKYGQFSPNYNIQSIPILEQKATELGITDLQHAENGGEFHIKELGYWVDGYSKEKNIVIEYYEPFHEKQKERDERRKQEIIDHLNCKFIEII